MIPSPDALVEQLQEAGLPTEIQEIIGRTFRFTTPFFLVVGTITGIQLTDRGELDLFVNVPFCTAAELPLDYLFHASDTGWAARVYNPEGEKKVRAEYTGLSEDDLVDKLNDVIYLHGDLVLL